MKPTTHKKTVQHVVSVSGGKDSTATLLLALARVPRENITAIFCDTGNEHEAVYAYLDYLELALDIKIQRLKADFSDNIARKRLFIANDKRTRREYERVPRVDAAGNVIYQKNNDGSIRMQAVVKNGVTDLQPVPRMRKVAGRKVRWTNKAKRRALAVLNPTGNPFLDLCLWKGRFPSRKAQFCTEELKRNLAVAFQLKLMDEGYKVVSWQGVRRDESLARRNAKRMETVGGGLYIFRPLVDWTAQQVFDYCATQKIQPNPLYLQGMGRVGCMPCINARKLEIREIATRFPEHIARIDEWERLVSLASKRGFSTFMHKGPADKVVTSDRCTFENARIDKVVHWSRTTHGGKKMDLLTNQSDVNGCSSSYGLCEQAA